MIALYVGLGSAIGGIARYLVGTFIQQRAGISFPLGTLVINVTGSFLLGFLLRIALGSTAISPERRALLTTGFCGGFTTFSTFSLDSVSLIEEGSYGPLSMYILLSVGLSILATFAGMALAESMLSLRGRA